MSTDQPSPADYGLTLPSEAQGDDAPPGNPEDVLLRIAEHLAACPDVAGVFGRSLAVRVNTYIALSTARTSA